MTRRLYYEDSHIKDFIATVTSCVSIGDRFAVTLDRTAFFPGGGGQPADAGTIGGAEVLACAEFNDEIIHYVNHALEPGLVVNCALDWPTRFRRMQNHSGEHIVSGIAHALFGYDNVGFHMDDGFVTIDLSGFLTKDALSRLECSANETVFKNGEVRCWVPDQGALAALDYRSKLELTEDVRIVEFVGVDRCACCAPHVKRTGEIGVIKILSAERHRGGMRLAVACGMDAYSDYCRKSENALEISNALSAKQDMIAQAVMRVLAEFEETKKARNDLRRQLLEVRMAQLEPSDGNMVLFEPALDPESLRGLVNAGMALCPGICAAFSGDDTRGYRYVIGSRGVDLRANAKAINGAISGRGGGSPEMISGTASATRCHIEAYFTGACVQNYGEFTKQENENRKVTGNSYLLLSEQHVEYCGIFFIFLRRCVC